MTGDNEIIIEAVWGLGEGIVSGKILPDHYVLSPNLDVKDKKISNKKIEILRAGDGTEKTINLVCSAINKTVKSSASRDAYFLVKEFFNSGNRSEVAT